MPWVTSNSGGAGYAWSALNTYNQHAAKITLPSSCAVITLRIVAAGYNTGTVNTRCALWNVGGSALAQSSTFSMADGSESTQYTYEKSITPEVLSSGDYWVGLYRDPSESHVFQTTSGSGNGYRKTNTSGFPSISSMSGYNTDSNDEPTVGAFYIVAPSAPNSQSVSRNSDTSQTVSWNRTASSDDPYYNQYVERWDNITGSWYLIYTNTSDYTTSGNNSYTDTTTVANRYYRYRIRAWNNAGYSSYAYTDYINTTPAAPSNVVGTRSGSSIIITWNDESTNEDGFQIARRGSNDGGDTWDSWDYSTLSDVGSGVETKTDTTPSHSTMQYAVRSKETAQTLYSGWTLSNEVVVLSTPDAPTGLNPNGGVFEASEAKTFLWNHNPTDNTEQTQFSLQYKISGGSYPGTPQVDEEVQTEESYEFAGSTFTNGNTYVYQVKTWGEYATGSDWSDEATFKCVTRPVATITDPSAVSNYNYSELTVEWSYTQAESEDQAQYLCKLYDSSDILLESKQINQVVTSGSSGSCTFITALENETTYKVTLQAQEDNGLWSTETEVEFTTEFLQPTKPSISFVLNQDSGSIDVTITNPEVVTEYQEDSTQDTYIDNDNSSTNYNDNGQLQLEDDTAGGTTIKRILLDFDLTSFIGKTIVDAQLNLYRKTALTPGIDSAVNYIKTSWDESSVTHGTVPTLDTTDYDDHTHAAGDSESWDLTTLLEDIADETITDYEGIAIAATTTDGSTDEFYDSTITDNEPTLLIEITPENADTDHNLLYRSVNGGNWELVTSEEIPPNTTVTDYIPNIGGNNNYYAQAVSDTPSTNNSEESDIDVELTGMFFINGGNGFGDFVRLVGDISISESINRNETIKQFAGRTYPVKYQGTSKIQELSFSADCPITKYDDLVEILESVGDIFYRDWRGRWFYVLLANAKFYKKDNLAYQFSCNITRLNNNGS